MHFSGSFLMCAPLMLRNLLINNGQNFDMNLPRVINPSFFFGFLQRQSKGMRFILGWPSCTLSIRVPHGRDHLFTGMTSSQDVPESLFFAGYILLLVFLFSQIYICYLMLFVFGMGYTCFLKNPQGQSYDLLVHVPLEWNLYTILFHYIFVYILANILMASSFRFILEILNLSRFLSKLPHTNTYSSGFRLLENNTGIK